MWDMHFKDHRLISEWRFLDVFTDRSPITWLYITVPRILNWACFVLQIVALNKTKERMRPYHSHQEDEDPDIKKIKKVTGGRLLGAWWPAVCSVVATLLLYPWVGNSLGVSANGSQTAPSLGSTLVWKISAWNFFPVSELPFLEECCKHTLREQWIPWG